MIALGLLPTFLAPAKVKGHQAGFIATRCSPVRAYLCLDGRTYCARPQKTRTIWIEGGCATRQDRPRHRPSPLRFFRTKVTRQGFV